MIVSFDKFDRYERPQFVLCNPGCVIGTDGALSGALGVLASTGAEENVFNFNSQSELNFRINLPKRPETQNDDWLQSKYLFRSIQNRRLIYQEGVGFFEISNVSKGWADGKEYKDVQAKSIEGELSHWKIPYVEGTSGFGDLLTAVVDTVPLWSVGDVDESLLGKYRTFEEVDTDKNCLSFMMEEMQEAYECIFIFDIQRRLVYAYDKSTYVKETDISISIDDLIPSATTDEGSDDLYTALKVSGENNIAIHPVNPLGNGVIYNFDHYIGWMSSTLAGMVTAWQDEIRRNEIRHKEIPSAVSERTYVELSEKYYEFLDILSTKKMEKQRAEQLRDTYYKCIDNIDKSVSGRLNLKTIQSIAGDIKSEE